MRVNVPQLRVDPVPFGGGLRLTNLTRAEPGTARFSLNYEPTYTGGYRRVGGYERFSGQPSPSAAEYVVLEASAGFTGLAVGDNVNGATSGATGRVVYLQGSRVGLGRVVGTFTTEVLRKVAVPVGTITEDQPVIDGFIDNELAAAAANDRRADIARVPGTGPIRGVAILDNVVYAWRDNAGSLGTYRSTPTGWVLVPLLWSLEFNGGSSAYTDGSVVTRGAASATVRRVVLETGQWGAGTAAGRLIVEPISGSFTAGVAGGGGVANLTGPATQITQFAGGRVRHDVHSFTSSLATTRLYCCDGVNTEWEFDGQVVVPIRTGMGGIRATAVKCHKNHLVYAYRTSLQLSSLGLPYQWSAVIGAAELGAGDNITNLKNVSGSEASAALMAICENSASVLYGSSILDWRLVKISDEAGAQPDSAQEMGGIVACDQAGIRSFRPTQSFGNFSYELASSDIEPLVSSQRVKDSVLVKGRDLMRLFFADGLFVSGTPWRRGFSWMACDYGRVIECCVGAEIDGVHRVFMGDSDGWVLEADVGRSFDGEEINAAIRMTRLDQGNRLMEKRYRSFDVDATSESACTVSCSAEFSEADDDPTLPVQFNGAALERLQGVGLLWDVEQWDRAYWDSGQTSFMRFAVRGKGRFITIVFQSLSANELPHLLTGGALTYIPGRMAR